MRESGRAQQICATIIETARSCNLDRDVSLPEGDEAAMALDQEQRDAIVGKVMRGSRWAWGEIMDMKPDSEVTSQASHIASNFKRNPFLDAQKLFAFSFSYP